MSTFRTLSSYGDFYQRTAMSLSIGIVAEIVASSGTSEHRSLRETIRHWLLSSSVTTEMSDKLCRLLHRRIACLNELIRWVQDGDTLPDNTETLQSWVAGVERAVSSVDGLSTVSLVAAPQITPDDEPRIDSALQATIWQTLSGWMAPQSVPRTVREAVDTCYRQSQRGYQNIPVPPAQGRPWETSLYIHVRHELADVVHELCAELQLWDDLALEDVEEQIEYDSAKVPARQIEFSRPCAIVARDELLAACQQLEKGWPLEIDRLQTACTALSAVIPTCGVTSSLLIEAFKPLKSGLSTLSARLAARQRAALVEAQSTAETTALPTVSSSGEDCVSELLKIYSSINHANADVSSTIRTDLAKLLERSRHDTDPGTRSGMGRDLVSLLVDIDAHIAEQKGAMRDLRLLRDDLQQVLEKRFSYKVLDAAALVGRPHAEVRDRVRVRYSISGGASGRIVHVHRPGYLFQFADGRVSVIRAAEVDVAG